MNADYATGIRAVAAEYGLTITDEQIALLEKYGVDVAFFAEAAWFWLTVAKDILEAK